MKGTFGVFLCLVLRAYSMPTDLTVFDEQPVTNVINFTDIVFDEYAGDHLFVVDLPIESPANNPDYHISERFALENHDWRTLSNYTQGRNMVLRQQRWANGKIPYVIDRSLSPYANRIRSTMDQIQKETCIRFVPRSSERNYVRIFKGKGCYSYVGNVQFGPQDLSLGSGCLGVGTITHELGHAIGLFHEQNRPDRDNYLRIFYQNIYPGGASQFKKNRPGTSEIDKKLDTASIMLYSNKAFSKNGRDTIESKDGTPLRADKKRFSKADIRRINSAYGCRKNG